MKGAEIALRTAATAGVDICFANPGTTEMELVDALDHAPGMRAVLCLFEGVATGAADGYARMKDHPALTLLHLGPGFANGIANLHNARRAHSPVINLVGDHAAWHVGADAPLTSDIESLAKPVSRFVRRVSHASTIAGDMAAAIGAANGPPSGVATLIVPQDAAWEDADLEPATPVPGTHQVDTSAVEQAARTLREKEARGLLLIGGSISARAAAAAAAIQAATGCRVFTDNFPARIRQGAGIHKLDQLPYFPEQAIEALDGLEAAAIVGTRAPVGFFGYRSLGRSRLLPEACATVELCAPGTRPESDLEALAAALDAKPPAAPGGNEIPLPPDAPLDIFSLGTVVAATQRPETIVVQEGATSALGWGMNAHAAPAHDVLHLTGGAIGQGLPSAVGAALAAPDRPVLALQADGSGLYTLQALWTMARENLDITVVLCANRAYRILQMELQRTGISEPGPAALGMTDLSRPEIGWTSLAKGFGVPAETAATTTELARLLRSESRGPRVIEALIS